MKNPHSMFSMHSSLLAATLAVACGAATAQEPAGHLLYVPDTSTQVDHAAIIREFEGQRFNVATFAPVGEDRVTYARRIADHVRGLMQQGVAPEAISVLGGGSGSDVALLTSAIVGNRHVNYVVLGGCDPMLKDSHHFRLAGEVLALRDAAQGPRSCRPLFTGSPRLQERRDVRLSTTHGSRLFDTARDEWTKPAVRWMNNGKVDVGEVNVAVAAR